MKSIKPRQTSSQHLSDRPTVNAPRAAAFGARGAPPDGIYLALTGVSKLRLSGLLITEPNDIDSVVAFIPTDEKDVGISSFQLSGSLIRRATKLASDPTLLDRAADAIDLRQGKKDKKAIPSWVYGLRCVPISGKWDGDFQCSRPIGR